MTKDDIAMCIGACMQSNPEMMGGTYWTLEFSDIERFANLVAAAERERICKAIKDEDDYCVTEGDYMLDSDDCIAVAKGEWVQPEFAVSASHVRSQS